MWVREEAPGNRAFFPTPDSSRFKFSADVGVTINRLTVEGCPYSDVETSAPGPSSVNTPREVGSRPMSSVTRRVQTVNVKIVKAMMKIGKPEFTPLTQTFVDVTETRANNINYILSAVQRKWGAQYIIVTSDGLKIEDGSGTQGMLKMICSHIHVHVERQI